jgi:hypothetical protein
MPVWVAIIGGWIFGAILFAIGWSRFMRAIRDWEDEREERWRRDQDSR